MRRPAALFGLAATLVACRNDPASGPQVSLAITRTADTIRFQAPAGTYRCENGTDVVIDAVVRGNGALVWLRPRDSMVSEFPVIGVRDTITRPAAVVAVRYASQAIARTLSLDSGTVTVTDSGGVRQVAVAGSGLEVGFAVRAGLVATFTGLPTQTDSTSSCRRGP